MRFRMIESELNFKENLKRLLDVEDDELEDIIEKLSVDELTDLVDASDKDDSEEAKKIVSKVLKSNEDEDDDYEDEDHEEMADRISSHKHKKEIGEDTDNVTFAIGDKIKVDGEGEGTVKLPSAPGDTIGVMINGEMKMVDKNKVHKLQEGVLGMTPLPGLKPHHEEDQDLRRMRELAGLRDESVPEEGMPEPAPLPPVAPEFDMDMDGIDDEMEDAHDVLPMTPSMDASMAPPLPAPVEFEEDGAAKLDAAIGDIESMIPNVKISEYKTLVARLKALVAMAESAGKAALTESRLAAKAKVTEAPFRPLKKSSKPFKRNYDNHVPPEEYLDGEADDRDLAPYRKPKEIEEASKAKYVDPDKMDTKTPFNPRKDDKPHLPSKNFGEDKISAKPGVKDFKKPAPPKEDGDVTRKTLMDYVREAQDDNNYADAVGGNSRMQTIGMNRNTALASIQNRMGPNATSQQATRAFDAMFSSGQIKQVGSAYQMAPMGDEDFSKAAAATPTASTSSTPQQSSASSPNSSGQQQSQVSNGQPGTGAGIKPNQPQQAR